MVVGIYRQFAEHILGDLAKRQNQLGEKPLRGRRRVETVSGRRQRIAVRGEHICYLGEERFHGSDRPFRLTMAVTASEKTFEQEHLRARGAHWNACIQTADFILNSPRASVALKQTFLEQRRGPKPKPTVAPLAGQLVAVQSGARRPSAPAECRVPRFDELERLIAENKVYGRRKRDLPSQVLRVAKVIRSQVRQYRLRNKGWVQEFDVSLGLFRAEHCRDAEWYEGAEQAYKDRIVVAEALLPPIEGQSRPHQIPIPLWNRLVAKGISASEADLAAAVINLACLYHEQSKFSKALACYKRATSIYQSPSVMERLRQTMLPWIGRQIANCKGGNRLDDLPVMHAAPDTDKPKF